MTTLGIKKRVHALVLLTIVLAYNLGAQEASPNEQQLTQIEQLQARQKTNKPEKLNTDAPQANSHTVSPEELTLLIHHIHELRHANEKLEQDRAEHIENTVNLLLENSELSDALQTHNFNNACGPFLIYCAQTVKKAQDDATSQDITDCAQRAAHIRQGILTAVKINIDALATNSRDSFNEALFFATVVSITNSGAQYVIDRIPADNSEAKKYARSTCHSFSKSTTCHLWGNVGAHFMFNALNGTEYQPVPRLAFCAAWTVLDQLHKHTPLGKTIETAGFAHIPEPLQSLVKSGLAIGSCLLISSLHALLGS